MVKLGVSLLHESLLGIGNPLFFQTFESSEGKVRIVFLSSQKAEKTQHSLANKLIKPLVKRRQLKNNPPYLINYSTMTLRCDCEFFSTLIKGASHRVRLASRKSFHLLKEKRYESNSLRTHRLGTHKRKPTLMCSN